jgi:nucleotide-binding universal stress UspA family protein
MTFSLGDPPLSTDSDVDALAWQFLKSDYADKAYADWPLDRRLDGFLTRRGLAGATPGSIFVGIDGSKTAIRAALWAADEAVIRDVPLRLLYAIEQGDIRQADGMAHKLSAAENALRQAFTAVEATGKPVKIETEIADGPPVRSLIRASASAAMVCVGAVGLRHFQPGRVGSTAAALAISGRCPVAIIRSRDEHHRQPR